VEHNVSDACRTSEHEHCSKPSSAWRPLLWDCDWGALTMENGGRQAILKKEWENTAFDATSQLPLGSIEPSTTVDQG
jgi:hypothetical protein